MRLLSAWFLLLLLGCALHPDASSYPEFQDVGSAVRQHGFVREPGDSPVAQCGTKQVEWCSVHAGERDCRCVQVDRVEETYRRIVRTDRNRINGRH